MDIKTLSVEFDDIPGSSARAEIVKAFLKYIVFERGLSPTHFDTLIRTTNCDGQPPRVNRQKINFIDSMTKILDCIDMSFCYPVEEVLVLLGGNYICPHDTYRITFPSTEIFVAEAFSSRKYVADVMKALVTWEEIPISPLPSSTNVHLFFLLPRHSTLHEDFILPSLFFQVPQSGLQFCINCSSKCYVELDSGMSSSIMSDMSGLEPIDPSICSINEMANSSEIENNELIWFKAPIALKGYKETIQSLF